MFSRVIRAAALALCSLTLKNQANKALCATLDAVSILLELGTAWGVAEAREFKTLSFFFKLNLIPHFFYRNNGVKSYSTTRALIGGVNGILFASIPPPSHHLELFSPASATTAIRL